MTKKCKKTAAKHCNNNRCQAKQAKCNKPHTNHHSDQKPDTLLILSCLFVAALFGLFVLVYVYN